MSFLSTPLHHAAYGGYLDIVQLLIQKNATNGIKDNYGTDAYDLAVLNGHEEVANYLTNNWIFPRGTLYEILVVNLCLQTWFWEFSVNLTENLRTCHASIEFTLPREHKWILGVSLTRGIIFQAIYLFICFANACNVTEMLKKFHKLVMDNV